MLRIPPFLPLFLLAALAGDVAFGKTGDADGETVTPVTQLLEAAATGDPQAAGEILPLDEIVQVHVAELVDFLAAMVGADEAHLGDENFRLVHGREMHRLSLTHARSAFSPDSKYLFTLPDGLQTEAVFMPYQDRNTICVSTMVGCPAGCAFCASSASTA